MKTAFLMTALTVLLVLIGDYFGGLQGMIVMLSFSVIMNFYAYWNSDKMVLRHYNAREVDAQSAPALYKMVQELARRGDLPGRLFKVLRKVREPLRRAVLLGHHAQADVVAAQDLVLLNDGLGVV